MEVEVEVEVDVEVDVVEVDFEDSEVVGSRTHMGCTSATWRGKQDPAEDPSPTMTGVKKTQKMS